MEANDNLEIKFRLEGPIFQTGIPLLETIVALQEFHFIIDKAYSANFNIAKLTKKERQHYSIIAQNFQKGSFEADLMFVIASGTQLLLPSIQAFGPKELWDLVKASFSFLKAIITARNSETEPTVNIEGHGNHVYIMNDNVIKISQHVYNAADLSEPHYKKLTSVIEKNKIDSITGMDSSGEGIELTENEKKLFNPKVTVEKEVLKVRCSVFRFDKEANIGKLRVSPGEPVPPGEYNFKPIASGDYRKFIVAMMHSSVTLNILKEIEVHTSGLKRISSLHVVSFEDFQQESLFSLT
ncbi:MAG: hypothetical protein HY787_19170 [Deltaproteobacteria bacterium]|nr:hypothetical protein [Deltaproteobacteria bacterium]